MNNLDTSVSYGVGIGLLTAVISGIVGWHFFETSFFMASKWGFRISFLVVFIVSSLLIFSDYGLDYAFSGWKTYLTLAISLVVGCLFGFLITTFDSAYEWVMELFYDSWEIESPDFWMGLRFGLRWTLVPTFFIVSASDSNPEESNVVSEAAEEVIEIITVSFIRRR